MYPVNLSKNLVTPPLLYRSCYTYNLATSQPSNKQNTLKLKKVLNPDPALKTPKTKFPIKQLKKSIQNHPKILKKSP